MVIVRGQSRDWLWLARWCLKAGREVVFVNERPVVGAPHVSNEEQMRRSPHVATERENREGRDERVTHSPKARLSSKSTAGRLHGDRQLFFTHRWQRRQPINAIELQNHCKLAGLVRFPGSR